MPDRSLSLPKRKPWEPTPLPPEALTRIQKNEARQRNATKKAGLPAEYVSVQALWLLHGGRCCCDQVNAPGCRQRPMDPLARAGTPDAVVIAHIRSRKGKQRGGHTPENVRLWRHACNASMASRENHDAGVGNRMAVSLSLKPDRTEEAPQPRSKWPKGRKLQSRNTFTTAKERAAVRALHEKTPIEREADA